MMINGLLFVTPLYAALLALWFVVLSVSVTVHRQRHGISFGDKGNEQMLRVIRSQGNFAEYVPLALLMMLFLEMSHFSIYLLHVLGIMLLASRLLHGYALSFTPGFMFGRVVGATLTWVVLVVEALLCLYQGWRGHWFWLTS